MRRTISGLGALLVAVLAAMMTLLAATSSPVSAHAVLDSSSPAASTVLSQPPSEIALDFSEPVEESFASIRLFEAGEADREIDIDAPRRLATDSSTLVASIPPVVDGLYVVVWRATSADGHPVSGAFPFEVGDTTSGRGADALDRIVASLNSGRSSLGLPLGIGRVLSYIGAILLIGMTVLHWRGSGLSRVRTVRTMTLAAVGFAVGASLVLVLQGPHSVGGGWSDVTDAALLADVVTTRVGVAMIARLVLALLWIVVILGAARGLGTGAPWQNAAFLVAVATTVTYPMAGHLNAVQWSVAHVGLGAVHVGAVAVWIGGLCGVVIGRRDDDKLLPRLSRLATWAMPVAVVTGVVNAARLTGGGESLFETTYGRTLTTKVALVLVAVSVAAVLRRRLSHMSNVGSLLRIEVVVALAVVMATATLTGSSPAAGDQPRAFAATLSQDGVIVDLAFSPASVGTAEVHVIFTPPGGALSPVGDVEVRMDLPVREIPSIPVDVVPAGPNHFVGVAQIPYEGEWSVEVRGTTKEGSILRWTTTMSVD